MTEHDNGPNGPKAAAPVVKQRRSLSIVWVIPLVALLVGGWLAYKAVTEKGPVITISFKSADGLEAGKTKVKFKEVEVGTVVAIAIGEDLDHVVLTVQMHKNTEPYLTADTRFWVVRARVSAGQVSGLGTLLAGAYIGVEPVSKGKPERHFKGLEKPPLVTDEMVGKRFNLTAQRLGSLNPGSPVYFRQIKVGQVVDSLLDDAGHSVGVDIFIQSPYDKFVRRNTRFWLASGLDLQLTADGLRIDTESLVSLIIGGIAFNTFADEPPMPEAEDGSRFTLHETREQARDERYTLKHDYYIAFTDSVRGLSVGAPVEFRGIQIGSVVAIDLNANIDDLSFTTLVRVRIERQRMFLPDQDEEHPYDRFPRLVEKGFRAQLTTGNLLTGQLFVAVDFFDTPPTADATEHQGLPVLPSIPSSSQQVMHDVARFVKKLDQLPLEAIGKDLQSTMAGIDRLVNSPDLDKALHALQQIMVELETAAQTLNTDTAPRVNAALAELKAVLKNLSDWISPDAPLQGDLRASLQEVSEAARALSDLADMLERHPEALIQGKQSEGR